MSLLALKRLLDGSDVETSIRTSISLLLDAAVQEAVQFDKQEHDSLCEDVRRLRRITTSGVDCTLQEFLTAMGVAANAIENYNNRTTRAIRKQSAEFHSIITMLTQTVLNIAGSATSSAKSLESFKAGLSEAAGTQDLQTLRLRMGDSLKLVCDEVERQKAATESVIAQLQMHTKNGNQAVVAGADLDAVTGLPLRGAAEAAFSLSLATRQKHFVITIVLDRLQSINARFGHDVGDQVMRALRRHVEQVLARKEDRLFRWTGPAIVLLMQRDLELNNVKSAVRRALNSVEPEQFEVGDRRVLIPLSVAWSAVALIAPAENVPKYIERFVASQAPREFMPENAL